MPPYAPRQSASCESMVKLFKIASGWIMEQTRRQPSLIELHVFFFHAVRILNDRPFTTLSDQPKICVPLHLRLFSTTIVP